jgi:hypothetical protein
LAAPLLAERKLTPLSRLGCEAIVARVVHRLKAEHRLGRYQPVGDTPGLARAIAGVIAELRLARLTSEAISKVAPDLARLSGAYEAALAEAGLTDWPSLLALATEAVGGGHRLVRLPTLLLDVSIRSTAEFALVGALAEAAPDFLATVPGADHPTLDRIRNNTDWEHEDLDGGTTTAASVDRVGTLVRLQRELFNDSTKASGASPDDEVEVA